MAVSAFDLRVESWTLYALGVCLILARTISRLFTLGPPSRLQCDDWIMVLVLIPFTATVFCANQAFIPKDAKDMAQWDIIRRLKVRFALEELQISTNWLVKGCLLILYRRIFPATTSKKERVYFSYTTACCFVAFLLIQILLPLWPRPVQDYWTLPVELAQNTYHNHAITTLTLSSTTTLLVLILPIPIIPTPRRFLLFTLLFLGIISLATGILGHYYVLDHPTSPRYLPWYIAETTTLIAYANIPFLSSLYSSAKSSRFRQLSNTSLTKWPRSYRNTPPLPAHRQRLGSIATTIGSLSPDRSQSMDIIVGIVAPFDEEEGCNGASPLTSAPPITVRKSVL